MRARAPPHAAASGHFSTEVRGGTEGGGLRKLAIPLSLAGRGAVADCTTPLGVLELLTPPAGSGAAAGSSACAPCSYVRLTIAKMARCCVARGSSRASSRCSEARS